MVVPPLSRQEAIASANRNRAVASPAPASNVGRSNRNTDQTTTRLPIMFAKSSATRSPGSGNCPVVPSVVCSSRRPSKASGAVKGSGKAAVSSRS